MIQVNQEILTLQYSIHFQLIMRNLIALFSLLFSLGAHAQTELFEVVDQIHPEVHFNSVSVLDSTIAVHARSDPGNTAHYPKRLLFYSLSGEPISSIDLNFINIIEKQHPSPSRDGGLWLGGALDGCDVLVGGRIIRFDRTGSITLDRTYTEEELEPTIRRIYAVAKNTTKNLAFGGNGVAIADTLGNITDYWTINGMSFQHNFQWYNDSILLNCTYSSIHMISIDGTPLLSRTLSTPIADVHVSATDVWVLGNNVLFLLGPDLATVDSFPYSIQPEPRRFVDGGSSTLIQLNNSLYQFSEAEGLMPFISPALVEGQLVQAYTIKDSTIFAVGDQSIEPYSSGFLKSYDLSGEGSDHDLDISVDGVTVDSLWMYYDAQSQWAYQNGNLTVMITNTGTEPINELMLAYRQGLFPITCGRPTTYLEITNADLLPGSSALYTMYDVMLWLGQLGPNEVIDHEVCVAALPQDGWMDRAIANNTACTPIQMQVDIQVEVPSLARTPKVSSSIVGDHINVVLYDPERTFVSIYNTAGVLVYEQMLEGAREHVIPSSEWNSGCYVLAFRSGRNVQHQRIVKE